MKIMAVWTIAKTNPRNGKATIANSTAAEPSLRRKNRASDCRRRPSSDGRGPMAANMVNLLPNILLSLPESGCLSAPYVTNANAEGLLNSYIECRNELLGRLEGIFFV